MGRFLREMGERDFVRIPSLSAIFFFCLVSTVHAGIIDELKTKQTEIKTVSARFMQEKHTKLLTKPIKSSGRFLYKQPDMIRWEYSGSVNMQVIYNGKELWLYYPELKEADKLTGLSQYGSLMHFDVFTMSRDYTITAKKENNIIMLKLAPKAQGPISQIEMEIPVESPFPRMIKLLDQNNEPTTITFRDVKLNPDLQDSSFTFAPDKEITVRERSLK